MENKIKNKLYSYYKTYLGKYFRFSSYPYLTGDTLRKYSTHAYDESSSIDPNKVMHEDKIFVKSDYLKNYFNEIHPLIKNKYILFSHNSDESIDSTYKQFFDEKIIHWFAQNLVEDFSENISLVPIGLENRWYLKNGRIRPFRKIQKNKQKKDIFVLSLFNIETNLERKSIKEITSNNSLIIQPKTKNKLDYLSYIQRSKFILCPEGNGPDTHRLWESLIFNSIPIMRKNNFSDLLIKYGIPIFLVDEWNELEKINEKILTSFYEKSLSNLEMNDYGYFSYWVNKFNQYLDE